MDPMDKMDRLNLQKMIQANDVKDCTSEIRDKRHSQKIRDQVTHMLTLKKKYPRLSVTNPDQFDAMLVSQCNFLFTNYTDIFNKVKKEEIILGTLWDLLDVLKNIEDGRLDQHDGAYEVGKLLKSIYIDGALMKADKIDKKTGETIPARAPVEKKEISWREYKIMDQPSN
jgi:hypothetical protein